MEGNFSDPTEAHCNFLISFHPESSIIFGHLLSITFLWSHLIWMIYLHCKHLSSINRWSATRVLVLQRRWRTWNLGCCQTAISYSRAKTLGGIWFLVSLVINIIVAFIAKIVCAHSANALWQMAIQLPKLRVAVRPHHVQIPVSRSLAVTTSHPPKVGRRSQNAMIFVFSVFSKRLKENLPRVFPFLDLKGCCFRSSAWEGNSGAEWEWFHREFWRI